MEKNRMKKRKMKPDGSFETKDTELLGIALIKKDEWCKDKGDKDSQPQLYKNL